MASTMTAQSTFLGTSVAAKAPKSRGPATRSVVVASSKKTDMKKQGLSSVQNEVVKANLMGISRKMKDKNWVDSQGRKGKGYGVYRYADKYGANVDGYSPIYTPDTWSETGATYNLGLKGLIAWRAPKPAAYGLAGLVAVLLAVGATLILSTSQIGS